VVVEDRFGACPLQKDSFKHIGHFYETFHHKRYLGVVTHLSPFVENLKLPDLSKYKKGVKLYGGAFIWVGTCRMDVSGPVAMLQRMITNEATGEVLHEAAMIVRGLKEDCALGLRYMPLHGVLRLAIVSDSSWKNLAEKYSQGGLIVALTSNRPGHEGADYGGYLHVIVGMSKKSGRVAESSWAAELLAAVKAEEFGSRINSWMHEIFGGIRKAKDEQARMEKDGVGRIELDIYLDAQDLVDTIVNE
jgi:hypothetical protein